MKIKVLFVGGILLTIVIRIYFILNGSDIADVHSLHEMGQIALKGENPYLLLNYNSYPPLALYIEEVTIKLSEILNIPFYMLIKLWPNLADVVTGLLIFWFLLKKGSKLFSAAIWSLIFLLNPISIIISAAHGQIDSVPSLLVIIAVLILQFKYSKKYIFLTAILLGIALSVKPNPLVLAPAFLIYLNKKIGFLEKLMFVLVIFIPIAVLLLPFLQNNTQYILGRLFYYSGSNDFGLSAILRVKYFHDNATYSLPYIDELLGYSKAAFLILLFIFMIIFRGSKDIIKLILVTYVLFLTSYFGISVQYLSWVLAFAVLIKDKMVISYTIFGLVAMLGYYFYFNPQILLVQFSSIQPYQPQFMQVYAAGNLLLWFIMFFWLVILIKNIHIRNIY